MVMPDINFADPMVYFDGNKYWAFATQNGSTKIQVAQADSASGKWDLLMDGDISYDALQPQPNTGTWSNQQNVWAPSVFQNINGEYLMYYSASMATLPGQHCIGVATSSTGLAQGPYVPYNGDTPLKNCHLDKGGSIDGSVFIDPSDNHTVYLVYKVDGNNVNKPTPIMLQRMADDGLTIDIESPPKQLITNEKADGPVVEAPNIIYINRKYVLFFSSNAYNTDLYDVSYAYSADLRIGDWNKTTTPLLQTNNPFAGMTAPGGASALVNPDGVTGDLYFHANCPVTTGKSSSAKRCMYYIPISSEVDDDSGVISIHAGS
ncbi:glycosyl hydrolase family 43 protein [Rutstroemia sp. NJR-2017a BVV2]|nr:glycosyl hydrolase family 43 protein [Rutstroemia sp. NJR-2017a BVV2]